MRAGGREQPGPHEDARLSQLYQQVTELQAPRFGAGYDVEKGLERTGPGSASTRARGHTEDPADDGASPEPVTESMAAAGALPADAFAVSGTARAGVERGPRRHRAVLPALPGVGPAGGAAGAGHADGRGGRAGLVRGHARRLAAAPRYREGAGVPAAGGGEPVPVGAAAPHGGGQEPAEGPAGHAQRRARRAGPAGADAVVAALRDCRTGSARRSCCATTRTCPRQR